MTMQSINPCTGEVVAEFETWNATQIEAALAHNATMTPVWAATPWPERARLLHAAAVELTRTRDELADIITLEMGKLTREARAEIEKCALVCDYYAERGAEFLADRIIESDAGRSLVAFQPLGTVLAVMPWNFPFWQVFRFAAPALAAGNTALLKHASNVPQCALAIERVFTNAGFPDGAFRTLMIGASQVGEVIADRRVKAVTLTGSEPAGRAVAAQAGAHLKKAVLELGGSDPFVVLEDADLALTIGNAVTSRFMNAGQSCIAAKRFIVVDAIADEFLDGFAKAVRSLHTGDPRDEATTLAPMARTDLREALHKQVLESLSRGAERVTGGECLPGPGAFYAATILSRVAAGMPAYEEEMFGPVAAVIRVSDADEALRVANTTRFGLGASVWTADSARGESFIRQIDCGCGFVNGLVKSDPRLPFGGVKDSGYGRELSILGMHEFVNAKTVWVR